MDDIDVIKEEQQLESVTSFIKRYFVYIVFFVVVLMGLYVFFVWNQNNKKMTNQIRGDALYQALNSKDQPLVALDKSIEENKDHSAIPSLYRMILLLQEQKTEQAIRMIQKFDSDNTFLQEYS